MTRIQLFRALKMVPPNEVLIDIKGIPISHKYPLGNGKTVISSVKPDGICNTCKGPVFNTERTHLPESYSCPTCDKNMTYTEVTLMRF